MDIKGAAGDVLEGSEKSFIGNWREGGLCYISGRQLNIIVSYSYMESRTCEE